VRPWGHSPAGSPPITGSCSRLLRHIEFLDDAIATCDREIAPRTAPDADALARLDAIPGVAGRTAETIVAELGCDMTRFPTAGHTASWTGDRSLPRQPREGGQTPQRAHPARQPHAASGPRRERARGAVHKRDSYLAAQYRRLVKRRGDKKAIVAVAHSLLLIAYHVLRDGVSYRELGGDYFDHLNADGLTRYRTKRLAALGYAVTLTKCAA
jgi:transposase